MPLARSPKPSPIDPYSSFPSQSAYDDLEDLLNEPRQKRPPPLSKPKNSFAMSQISSIPSQTQSHSGMAFPTYYRPSKPLTGTESLPQLADDSGSSYDTTVNQARQSQSHESDNEKDRVVYKPIPEKHQLGYLSTAALIINKMIGTGIFSKPSAILKLTGSKGGALFLWVTGGIMTLTG